MKPDNIFNRHPVISMIVLLFFIFLATDIIGKNILKFYFKSYFKKNDHEKEYRIPSNYYHHDLKPNVNIPKTTWGNFFFSVATNSLGLRDKRPRQVPLSSSHHRILFIGDSFTEGVGIAYEKTFVGIIDDAMQKRGIEILNAAVCSYSPAIYYAKVKHLVDSVGLQFNELIVFIDISDIHDEATRYRLDVDKAVERKEEEKIDKALEEEYRTSMKKKRTCYHKIEQILQRDTVMTYLIVKKVHDLFFSRDYSYDYDSINLRGDLWTINKSFYEEYGKLGLDESAKNMDLLANLCRDKKIILTIAVYPWPDQIIYHDLDSLQVKFWSNWAKKHHVKFINYFPHFILPNQNHMKVRNILDTYFIPGDMHWNEEGHRKVAHIFLNEFHPSKKESYNSI